jgi:L-cysteine desulfidase
MNESILNPFTIITVLSFLAIFVLVAFFIRKKSSSLKKIINNKKINVIEYSPIRVGYSAIIFSVEKEKFFFVGHKSGHSNLVQILTSQEEKVQKTTNDENELNQNDKISNTSIEKENTPISSKIETKKPLEQVNISDLLALHKKS